MRLGHSKGVQIGGREKANTLGQRGESGCVLGRMVTRGTGPRAKRVHLNLKGK